MGYRVKRIQALEKENEELKKDKEFWELEAKRHAAELGELKMKIGLMIERNLSH